jgi:hypothetical protein
LPVEPFEATLMGRYPVSMNDDAKPFEYDS